MKNLNFWKPIVGESWYLNNHELFDSPEMNNLMGFITQEYKKGKIAPNISDIFKAFRLTSYHDVRVIITSEGLYSNYVNDKPVATGLPFANPKDSISLEKPLKHIIQSVEKDVNNGLNLNFDITLEKWAKQGVLLLNASLTVNVFRKDLHKNQWFFFINSLILKLNSDKVGLHFCFWGKEAQKYNNINGLFHYDYYYMHPNEATSKNIDWNCTHFSQINNNIIGQNSEDEIINW